MAIAVVIYYYHDGVVSYQISHRPICSPLIIDEYYLPLSNSQWTYTNVYVYIEYV